MMIIFVIIIQFLLLTFSVKSQVANNRKSYTSKYPLLVPSWPVIVCTLWFKYFIQAEKETQS
jgi:hypothetical protein